ncbi:hypothetical protein C1H46_034736 [Malus baccata]|uniref:Uncharacterized protein n=1 Tax=Malus baccata TaxID=106549 RepID=A0A540KZQ5_MALBA|nr:hypothetical protein C1H46_034736 [Malus baccata]
MQPSMASTLLESMLLGKCIRIQECVAIAAHFKDDLPTIRFSPRQICMREQKNETLKSVSNVIPFNLGEDAPVAMGNNGQGFSEISMGLWDYRTLHC